jgi:hypothetical protein
MAPHAADPVQVEAVQQPPSPTRAARTIPQIKKSLQGITQSPSFPAPLQYSGSLDAYESFDVTNAIGREFPKVQLSEIIKDDAKIRDLAITGMSS